MSSPFELDHTPIDTDWTNLDDLFLDMRRFAEGHPNHKFICADDPGILYDPWRAPRLGWVAYLDDAGDEQAKSWTIRLSDVQRSLNSAPKEAPQRLLMRSSSGRQQLLEQVIGRAPDGLTASAPSTTPETTTSDSSDGR